jgi:ABC-type tungstate transport system substrate-binding protein
MVYATATARSVQHNKGELARLFVLSLIPIAVAYHLAHYLSFLLLAGQLIIPLASDPFGFGWDLLGTARYRLNIGIINTRSVWVTAVVAIVVGHIIAVYLAHVMALRVFKENRLALRSQYPMLVLMVGYTIVGLWILAQPIVE